MLKLLSWRRHTVSSQTPISLSFSRPKSHHHNLLNQETLDQDSDPPFSPIKSHSPTSKSAPEHKKKEENNKPIEPTEKAQLPVHSDLPFDFQYSYSETNPMVKPISFREPRFSPFGPGRLDRKWTGYSAPVCAEVKNEVDLKEVQGSPLSEEEIEELVEKYGHDNCNSQINLGKGGVTHNMLDDIHNHWKRAEAVRIKCLGVPTLDMDNVIFHLEDKTSGKVISRRTNVLLLYRGRNYDPKQRPHIPLMLWKPLAPIYPRLVKNVADGLTFEETKEMRNRGLNSPPIMRLTRNGVYVSVMEKVREAFKLQEVVRIDCSGVDTSDCKKIGVKLRDMVPCVPLLFKNGQIVLWRGRKDENSNTVNQKSDT
ncbi:hypothetical protein AMTRI_Chr11g99360 [Amborella trichopoda]|uniref:CRM domain-containing protein n=1 Tax=Amborella trichopoda TaxID=13333 RepID=W1P1U0_AMBTC|nr:CRS2-associated factor 2, mitochondrial isoform X2 [Amborella trichopoda]ERN00920.1 hypothetical protein AMTR_s00340p00004320 [Amborella trichopoda]|eukprot:XP_006838351.1 CRS2-associated factor 2, mitochondrial isoform X2 [Amborella trichopoda]